MKRIAITRRFLAGKIVWISLLIVTSASFETGQAEENAKQLNDLAQSMCDGDLDCIRELSENMRDVQQQMREQLQSPSASSSGYRIPCQVVVPPYSCIPITVAMENRYVEQSRGYIHTGVLPDNPEEYVSNFITFHYVAEATGQLLYTENFSRFQALALGAPETTRILAFQGYTQSLDQNDRLHRRNYNTAGAEIRRPFDFGFHYPDTEFPPETAWTNMMLTSAEVETHDDWLSTFGGSRINGGDKGIGPRFYITPEVLKTIIADGGFEKHYEWRDTQPGDNHWSDNDLTVRVALAPSCAVRNLAVKITTPKVSKRDYSFSKATPGELKMTLHARATPARYSKQIEWEIPQLAGSTRKLSPQDGKGPKLTVVYTGLPKNNDAFGNKAITARVKVKGCTAEERINVRLFFPRDEQNNPDGKVPNWYYYWSQTKARGGKAKYGGKSGRCGKSTGRIDELLGYHRNEIFSDHYTICDLGSLGKEFLFKEAVQWPKGSNPSMISTKGIDTFAVVSRHENTHLGLTLWWNKYRTTDPKVLNSDDLNHNRVPDTIEAKLDTDMDRVPNSVEASYGLNPNTKYSYPPPITQEDEEMLAWRKELESWNIGQGKTEDWACPGSNAASCP